MLPPEITFIERGWFNANSVVIHGRYGPTLVDSGHWIDRHETVQLLRDHGVDPETIQQIVVTHCHSDHHGANRILKALSGAPVGMGWITADWFARGERHLTWFDQASQEVDVVPADFVLHEGDTVELGDMGFEVLHLPGHAPDSIGLYQPDHKIMICADAMWHNDVGVLNTITHPGAVDQALASIEKLKRCDIRIAIPGHGGLITNVAENLERVTQKLHRFQAEPGFLAQHYLRRMMMYLVLRYQPATRLELAVQMEDQRHFRHFLNRYESHLPHIDLGRWQTEILDLFLAQGILLEDEHGRLSSTVAK